MPETLIHNATIINEGKSFRGELLIRDELIAAVGKPGLIKTNPGTVKIDASGFFVMPGVIDEHVHFREPGLTDKGDIRSESTAAAAGGITSFMDMPNTIPPAVNIETLEEKYRRGSENSLINYSFYIGATNSNLDEILRTDPGNICGIKLFMGSSTGNMLMNDIKALRELFRNAHIPLAVHCEDEKTIKNNTRIFLDKYGEEIPVRMHPLIRSRDACFISSSFAVELAREYNTRLHILHLSTADEMKLLNSELPAGEKRITAEACVHHLWFDESSYDKLGTLIKWNPAIKTRFDRESLINAIINDQIDVIATDHAPHTYTEKLKNYFGAPSGAPLVQHSLVMMFELYHRKIIPLEKIVEKMCHNPAALFRIKNRGFIREGYYADLCIVDPNRPWTVSKDNIIYRCGWSPLEGTTFRSKVRKTLVNGTIVFDDGIVNEEYRGRRLKFDRC
ncbi:MAG: dihydroorotase [Bacteroidales bacterium]|nr:dihydroorotase [Bacteroidales bacterium]